MSRSDRDQRHRSRCNNNGHHSDHKFEQVKANRILRRKARRLLEQFDHRHRHSALWDRW